MKNNQLQEQTPICLLCKGPLRNPLKTICQHIFCQKCILSWLNKNLMCPCNCGIIFTNELMKIFDITSNTGNFHYKCKNNKNGCDVILLHSEIDFHLENNCKFSRNISMNSQNKRNSLSNSYLNNEINDNNNINFDMKIEFLKEIIKLTDNIDLLKNNQIKFIDFFSKKNQSKDYLKFIKNDIEKIDFMKIKKNLKLISEKFNQENLNIEKLVQKPKKSNLNVSKNTINDENIIPINIKSDKTNFSKKPKNQKKINTSQSNLEIQRSRLLQITNNNCENKNNVKNMRKSPESNYLLNKNDNSILKTFIDLSREHENKNLTEKPKEKINQILKSSKLTNINQLNSICNANNLSNKSLISSKSSISCSPSKINYDNLIINLDSIKNDKNSNSNIDSSKNNNDLKSSGHADTFNITDISIRAGLTSNIPSPFQQKIIIKNLMYKEYGTNNSYHDANKGKINEPKFIINSKWWRSWLEYVNFDNPSDPKDIPPYNNFTGKRPFFLNNKDLLKLDHKTKNVCNILKDNLLEHHDYEAVSKEIYKNLKKWYNSDIDIIRFLKNDSLMENKLILELYPERKKNTLSKDFYLPKNMISTETLKCHNISKSLNHNEIYEFSNQKNKKSQSIEKSGNCAVQ